MNKLFDFLFPLRCTKCQKRIPRGNPMYWHELGMHVLLVCDDCEAKQKRDNELRRQWANKWADPDTYRYGP